MKKILKMLVGYGSCIVIQLVAGLLCAAITTPIINWVTDDDKLD